MSPAQQTDTNRAEMEREFPTLRARFMSMGLPSKVVGDLVVSLTEWNTERIDGAGHKVHVRPFNADPMTFFVAKRGARFLIVGNDSHDLGREVLWLVEQGKTQEAQAWLEVAVDKFQAPRSDDPLSTAPFYYLWKRGHHGNLEEIRASAISLLKPEEVAASTIEHLRRLLEATKQPSQARALRHALLDIALRNKDATHAWPLAEQMLNDHPESITAQRLWARCAILAGKAEAAIAFCDRQLARNPSEDALESIKVEGLQSLGRFAESDAFMLRRIETGKSTPFLYNNLAWSQVIQSNVNLKTIEWARLGAERNQGDPRPALHTLAAVLADSGRTTEARETILKSVSQGGGDSLRPEDWYVFGRIADQLGEPAEASDWYRRTLAETKDRPYSSTSTAALAQRRLDALQAAKRGH